MHKSIWVTTNMVDLALPAVALPVAPGTIQTSNVPTVELPQTTPSASGLTEGMSIMLFVSRITELQLQ